MILEGKCTDKNSKTTTKLQGAMDKESIYELQKIDCNCNDCKFMVRDFDKFKKWENWNREMQLADFAIKQAKEIEDAKKQIPYNQWLVDKAMKMQFQFDRKFLISYGHCTKFDKDVSFIPEICQLENQECFEHRRS